MKHRVTTVLFDMGGVLAPDMWETIVLTPELGLADRLQISAKEARDVGLHLWTKYSRGSFTEAAYWDEFGEAIGRKLPAALIKATERATVHVNPFAEPALQTLKAKGVTIGIISNNTRFWFRKQSEMLHLNQYVAKKLVFLSHEQGRDKSDRPGLFDLAASKTNPETSLVIDDRPRNLMRAEEVGFHVFSYGGIYASDQPATGQFIQAPFLKMEVELNPPQRSLRSDLTPVIKSHLPQ